MNADYKVSTSFSRSRKWRRLKRLLGWPGIAAIYELWGYVARERPDGDLSSLTDEDIADEIGWEETTPEVLCKAFAESGLLDGVSGSYKVHNWKKRQPWCASADERSTLGKLDAHKRTKGIKKAAEIVRKEKPGWDKVIDAWVQTNEERAAARLKRADAPPKTEPAQPAQTELIPQESPPPKPKPKPKAKPKTEKTGPTTPAARIVTEYKRLMALESYDPRASYKLINGLIAAGVTEDTISEVVKHSVKNPRTLPDGAPLTNLNTILSTGWFPQEQARAQASKPKPVSPELQAKFDRAADMYANRFTRMIVRDGVIDAPEPQSDSFLKRHHGWDPTTETKDSALLRVRSELLERQKNGEKVYSVIDPPAGPPPSKDMCWRS